MLHRSSEGRGAPSLRGHVVPSVWGACCAVAPGACCAVGLGGMVHCRSRGTWCAFPPGVMVCRCSGGHATLSLQGLCYIIAPGGGGGAAAPSVRGGVVRRRSGGVLRRQSGRRGVWCAIVPGGFVSRRFGGRTAPSLREEGGGGGGCCGVALRGVQGRVAPSVRGVCCTMTPWGLLRHHAPRSNGAAQPPKVTA